jgi:hypothetical protein
VKLRPKEHLVNIRLILWPGKCEGGQVKEVLFGLFLPLPGGDIRQNLVSG